MSFGPTYPKINTVFKRDEGNVIIPGDWSRPEFEFLSRLPWLWTEKIDGTNIRLHYQRVDEHAGGQPSISVGGRTNNAQLPNQLLNNLEPQIDLALWDSVFPDADDVTVYGEGYGAKIQSGGAYRPDQALIVFDVRVGRWWLEPDDVRRVAAALGLEVVPSWPAVPLTLVDAVDRVRNREIESAWPGVQMEGLVGRPVVDLYNRAGDRIMTKLKVKDFDDYDRKRT